MSGVFSHIAHVEKFGLMEEGEQNQLRRLTARAIPLRCLFMPGT